MNGNNLEELMKLDDSGLRKLVKANDYDGIMVLANRFMYLSKDKKKLVEAAELFESSRYIDTPVGFVKRPDGEHLLFSGFCFEKARCMERAISQYQLAGRCGYLAGFYKAGRILEKKGVLDEGLRIYFEGKNSGSLPCEGRYIHLRYNKSDYSILRRSLGGLLRVWFSIRFFIRFLMNNEDHRVRR